MDVQNSLFGRLQKRPEICTNCWRQRFELEGVNYLVDTDKGEVYARPLRKSLTDVVLPHREYDPDQPVVPFPEEGQGMTHICECGVLRPSTTVRPLSTSDAIEVGQRVLERAEDAGYSVDADSFFDKLRGLKSDPDEQFRDDEILARSLDAGLKTSNNEQ